MAARRPAVGVRSVRCRGGLNPFAERLFRYASTFLVLGMLTGWALSLIDLRIGATEAYALGRSDAAEAPIVARTISNALLDRDAPKTAYLADAALQFLDPLRGESGKLRAVFRTPGERLGTPSEQRLTAEYVGSGDPLRSPDLGAPEKPGIYKIALELANARKELDDLSLVTIVPFSRKREGKVGVYLLGTWPYEQGGTPKNASYGNPRGFIEVTVTNKDTRISEHFKLADFLTKDQKDVWPKYVIIEPKLLDKLELAIAGLQERGVKVTHVQVMSGFRTPRYNHAGGNTKGRANLSRHMYGDAADVFVDNDKNGWMDDINRDGRSDQRDSELLAKEVERVEREHPSLVGGIGIYTACCGHGPFTHVDVRGFRARWRGTGNG